MLLIMLKCIHWLLLRAVMVMAKDRSMIGYPIRLRFIIWMLYFRTVIAFISLSDLFGDFFGYQCLSCSHTVCQKCYSFSRHIIWGWIRLIWQKRSTWPSQNSQISHFLTLEALLIVSHSDPKISQVWFRSVKTRAYNRQRVAKVHRSPANRTIESVILVNLTLMTSFSGR